MAFVKIDWKPDARHLRLFSVTLLGAMGAIGSLFYWGGAAMGVAFFNRPELAVFLWGFALVAFVTGITGTKLGYPTYYLWMGFVFVISTVIGYASLVLIYYLVVTPIGLLGRLCRRDKLQLKKPPEGSLWLSVNTRTDSANSQRQY